MEHFLAGSQPKGPVADGISWRETGAYVEAKVFVASHNLWLPVYIITVQEGIGAAATCWDHQFDALLDQLAKPQIEKIWRRLYPTWFACMDNAINERYGEGALLELLDPDDVNRKWMIAVMFSHRAEDKDRAAAVAMDRVIGLSASVAEQFENKPSTLDYARVAAAGFVQGASQENAFISRIREASQWISLFQG